MEVIIFSLSLNNIRSYKWLQVWKLIRLISCSLAHFNILVLKGYLIDKSILLWKWVRSAHFRINFLSFHFLYPCNTNWCRFDSLITSMIFTLSRIFWVYVLGFHYEDSAKLKWLGFPSLADFVSEFLISRWL